VRAAQAAITSQRRFFPTSYGAEFIAKKVRAWIGAVGAKTAFIAPGSPWANGYCESFNARFRNELLNGEVFNGHTKPVQLLHAAKCLVAAVWRTAYLGRTGYIPT